VITKYNCKNDYLKLDSEYIIIATSPKIHLEMLKKVINQGKKVIIEKPVVRNLQELQELKTIINPKNYYNSLHFAHGLEIDFFIKNMLKRPNKIYAYISDNYVQNEKVIDEAQPLCGSYLDEVINPLSAIYRILGGNIKFINREKKYYENDEYDYYSISEFTVSEIPVTIEVLWNTEESKKYIDLYYDDMKIRLDSMNQKVIDLDNNKVLFQGKGDRMTNHYIGVFTDYLKNGSNIEVSLKLHQELLKGVEHED